MGRIENEILIQASVEKIWAVLANPALLDQYDPTVRTSTLISILQNDVGAKRRVVMQDGKNWFEEVITEATPNASLTYELTACSFPVKNLRHRYSFQQVDGLTRVTQVMEYTVKFGLLGRLMDVIMIRKQSDAGIKKFFAGLKSHIEKH